MKTMIVLAMHGSPPRDFPRVLRREMRELRSRLEVLEGAEYDRARERADFLAYTMIHWPRTPVNDPYHAAAMDLGARLRERTQLDVIVAFNEFCAPGIEDALERAARNADEIVIATTMLSPGGSHADREIPGKIRKVADAHPRTRFTYAWPFDADRVAAFLEEQIGRRVGTTLGEEAARA